MSRANGLSLFGIGMNKSIVTAHCVPSPAG
jgi:hypothetical protein